MPRPGVTSDMLAALTASVLRPAVFVAISFATETLYLWSGVGSITVGSQIWTGVGSFGGISVIEEGATVEAKGLTLTLSGVDSEALADALQEIRVGQTVAVYLGLFDDTNTLIDNPILSWVGRTDQPTIDVTGTNAVISIAAENRLMEMNVPSDRRLTLEDSQLATPGELGFQFVNALQEILIQFGSGSAAGGTNV